MEIKRKRFQGVINIIRFNWHIYLMAILIIFGLLLFKNTFPKKLQLYTLILATLSSLTLSISLVVSYYVYDFSDLYKLNWLPDLNNKSILTVNAGFDETSEIIKNKYKTKELVICDFYNAEKHTEISIERARRIYPPSSNTIKVTTDFLPFKENQFDITLAIFSIHEIREIKERVIFFKEINRVTKESGQILITEHIRDLKNFISYTFGAFHFLTKPEWLKTFKMANLEVTNIVKITPFVTTFELKYNGSTY